MLTRFRRIALYAVPLLVGACFFAATRLPSAWQPGSRTLALGALWIAAAVIAAVASLLGALGGIPLRRAAHVALTPTVLAAASFGAFLSVERDLSRVAVAVATMALLAAHFAFVAGMRAEASRYGTEDLGHISFAIHVVASFFCLVCAFAVVPTLAVPLPAASFAVGLFVGLVAWETLWHEGFAVAQFAPVALAFGALGAEFHAALSFLPTSPIVDAAVELTLIVSALHAALRVLKGMPLLRRHAALTLALTVLVLGTARWT
jgi:hypothetical protein